MSDSSLPPSGTHPAAWPVRGPQWIDPNYGEAMRERRRPRPKSVTAACLLTWFTTGLIPYFYLLQTIGFFVMPDDFIAMMMRWQGMRYVEFTSSSHPWTHLLLPVLWTVWSIAAFALAFYVWHRNRSARRWLLCSAGLALPVALLTFPASFFQLIGIVGCITLLLVSRRWFTDRGSRRTSNRERIAIRPRPHNQAESRRKPSSRTSSSLQKAQRTKGAPSSES